VRFSLSKYDYLKRVKAINAPSGGEKRSRAGAMSDQRRLPSGRTTNDGARRGSMQINWLQQIEAISSTNV